MPTRQLDLDWSPDGHPSHHRERPLTLTKYEMDGTTTDFELDTPTEVTDLAYHPDGLPIALVLDGTIWMADNNGVGRGTWSPRRHPPT